MYIIEYISQLFYFYFSMCNQRYQPTK